MKKIAILLVIIFTFLFSTTSWGDWEFVVKSVKGDEYYYDKDRVRKSGKHIYFWMLSDYFEPSPYGDLSSTKYIELDCSIFRYKDLKGMFYKKSMGEGEKSYEVTPPNEWNYPKPASAGESILNRICEEHQYVGVEGRRNNGVLYKRVFLIGGMV